MIPYNIDCRNNKWCNKHRHAWLRFLFYWSRSWYFKNLCFSDVDNFWLKCSTSSSKVYCLVCTVCCCHWGASTARQLCELTSIRVTCCREILFHFYKECVI